MALLQILYVSEYSSHVATVSSSGTLKEVNLPTPTADGYTFLGWYYDEALTNKAEIGDTITDTTTLYAKWEAENIDASISFKSKITALADEIRILSGTEGTMGLDAMKSNVSEANANVDTEADLIAQISAALEGKAGGTSVETCTVTFWGDSSERYPTNIIYVSLDDNGDICYKNETCSTSSITVTCLKNTIVTVNFKNHYNPTSDGSLGIRSLFCIGTTAVFRVDSDFSYGNTISSGGGTND